ncbi:hypothetical protein FEM48_Zijuj01G0164700 [Ziziphus jujuba var. spinosa]|uniref:DUF4220 domain-containing protein n=1 Tax=Ziziphus jujuba var. spinosa TaxID=714518 RepID=A0A978W2B5_ZIZJJ|nr:hypothetical protein FEM48_Zijuj01G0164700 [Ziziphus jujuba var. spinosa]
MHTYLMAKRLKDFWDNWGIEVLVTVSCGMHMVLTLFGSSRRRMTARQGLVRFIIWSAYLLSSYVVTVIIGKLTLIQVNESTKENTDSELKGFLAPLLLVQLGSRDAITAYSIEDDRLGLRQFPNVVAQLSAVLWILFRSWNNSLVSYLYFPLLLAGSIKYGENAWALYTALSGSSGITTDEFEQEEAIQKVFKHDKDIPNNRNLEMILKAYYRFFCLKPHIETWIYRPLYITLNELSIDNMDSPLEIFQITDFELGFMYDVLYTKAPIVYTRTGFVLRLITSLSLVSCSIAFAIWFKDAFVYYINAGFTIVVLGVILTLEIYQIYMLLFSEWAILTMIKHSKNPIVKRLLIFLAPQATRWKRWSNTLGQFNLIRYCLDYDNLCCSRILKLASLDIQITNWRSLDKPSAREVSGHCGRYGITELHTSVDGTEFDKSILVWHLATEICYHSHIQFEHSNSKIKMGRYLSNYMMYLLALRSQMLSITTSEIVLEDARKQITEFLKDKSSVKNVETACRELKKPNVEGKNFKAEPQTMVTRDWYLLKDAKQVSENLLGREGDTWEVIFSVWVEMLCFAATHCRADNHAEQLRRGGEIVTHVWLMLLHQTDAGGSGSNDQP